MNLEELRNDILVKHKIRDIDYSIAVAEAEMSYGAKPIKAREALKELKEKHFINER